MQQPAYTHAQAPTRLPVPHIGAGAPLILGEQEQYFLAVAAGILAGIVTPEMESVFRHLEGADVLYELARELCAAYHGYGPEGFWKSYDGYDSDIPRLQELREMLAYDHQSYHQGILLTDGPSLALSWLWDARMALGTFTVLEGEDGAGKTSIALDIAARVTMGRPFPDYRPALQGGVVLIMPDDELWDTLSPRLASAGADLSKIVAVSRVPTIDPISGYAYERPFRLPDDIALLDRAMQRVHARLVIIDPLLALFKDTSGDLRPLLAPVQALLYKYQASGLIINPPAGFARMARAVLRITEDAGLSGQLLLRQMRAPLGEYVPDLAYYIASGCASTGVRATYVAWRGISDSRLYHTRGKISRARQEILALLSDHYPAALDTQTIASALPNWTLGNIRTMLYKMVNARQIIKQARGLYAALTPIG